MYTHAQVLADYLHMCTHWLCTHSCKDAGKTTCFAIACWSHFLTLWGSKYMEHTHTHANIEPIMQFCSQWRNMVQLRIKLGSLLHAHTHTHKHSQIHTQQTGTSHSNNQHRLAFWDARLEAIGMWVVCSWNPTYIFHMSVHVCAL